MEKKRYLFFVCDNCNRAMRHGKWIHLTSAERNQLFAKWDSLELKRLEECPVCKGEHKDEN